MNKLLNGTQVLARGLRWMLAIYIDGAAFHQAGRKRRDQFIRNKLANGTPPWKLVTLTAIDLKRGKELVDYLKSTMAQ